MSDLNNSSTYKLQAAISELESLKDEVEQNLHIPIRFRKTPPAQLKNALSQYIDYLKEEINSLKRRIGTPDITEAPPTPTAIPKGLIIK